jgi:hypothetical protein
MPAFTFEKISPPAKRGPVGSIAKNQSKKQAGKQRGLIVQILDRFAEARIKKSLRGERSAITRRKSKTSD